MSKTKKALAWAAIGIMLVVLNVALVRFLIERASPRPKLLNLESNYNGATIESTTVKDNNRNPNTLEEFPLGENEFGGIRFRVSGILQLNGRYPDKITGVPVGAKCRRIHLLHGTAAKAENGIPIAKLLLHYANGQSGEIPIRYGEHVRDWWQRPTDPPYASNAKIAWKGQNQLTRKENASLNIYVNTFESPQPSEKIVSIDFISENTTSWPFFLGLTTE